MATVSDPALVTNHSVQLTGLNPNTTYNFTVRSATAAGSASTANGSFATPDPPATITSPSAGTPSTNSLVLTWVTDLPSDSEVEF
jgi:hypothetical protein